MIEVAAILSVALGDWSDFAIIVSLLLVNAAVDFWQERKAGDAIEALKEQLASTARVLRDGAWTTLPTRELVPGDVVELRIGNVVPADVKLVTGDYLSTDESALTGESLPVDKAPGDDAWSGSSIKLGEMRGIVTATGMDTRFGKTAGLVDAAETHSHFRQAVLKSGHFLILTTIALVAAILAVAVHRDTPFWQTVQFCLILTVAAIPVALPTVLSVTMAVGAEKLARMKAIVSRLVAIEELAGVDVLCADKTGTLTANRLSVVETRAEAGVGEGELMRAARLASDPDAPDAIDAAVLAADPSSAGEASSTVADDEPASIERFVPFDPISKRTEATAVRAAHRFRVSKGAPQVILDLVSPDATARARVEADVEALAGQGFRALGVADAEEQGGWRFLGLLAILDPHDARIASGKRRTCRGPCRSEEMRNPLAIVASHPAAMATLFTGAVVGLYFQPPGVRAFFGARTGHDESGARVGRRRTVAERSDDPECRLDGCRSCGSAGRTSVFGTSTPIGSIDSDQGFFAHVVAFFTCAHRYSREFPQGRTSTGAGTDPLWPDHLRRAWRDSVTVDRFSNLIRRHACP